ncbi:MAG: ATP-dependent DNA ligase [Nitrososphaerales archaeon]
MIGMEYILIAEAYKKMEETTKRLDLTSYLVELFKATPTKILDKVVYLTQGKLYPDYMGVEIGVADKLALRAIVNITGLSVERVEEYYKQKGDIGTVAQDLLTSKKQQTLFSEPLTVERVYSTLDKIAKTTGSGSLEIRLAHLQSLLNDATPLEAKYLMRTVTGKLRLGIADYTVLDALAVAFTGDKENRIYLERAYNISSDLGSVAKTVAEEGLEGILRFKIQIGKPVRPMLAERLESAEAIVEKMGGECAIEYKLDGERLQIHKLGEDVNLFSRRLENITAHYPDAINLVKKHIKAKEVILDGEAVAINEETGEYLPFQEIMHRRRKYGIEEAMRQYPISLNLFDILYLEGEDLTQKPYFERRKILEKVTEKTERINVIPAITTADPNKIEEFMQQAILDGCEGIVAKDLKSSYRAGAREFAWIKLKREYKSELQDTIDLVIVGAFYGKGKRAGKYGTFLLAAYDKADDTFKTATKIGTGFTDEDLARFPEILQPYIIPNRHARVESKIQADVWFTPKVVIEVVASEVTLSPVHTCAMDIIKRGVGLALRFPKYTGRLRDDKAPEDATTVQEIVELYRSQLKKIVE